MIPGVRQEEWREVGTLTVAQAIPTTDKSYATLSALASTKIVFLHVSSGTIAEILRFSGTATDDDSNVVEVYAMRGRMDHFSHICTLKLTTGTQVYSTGIRFVDTIVVSNENWVDDVVASRGSDDGIAHVIINTHGWEYLALIAPVLNSTSIIVEASEE